jgi:transcriptional regulator with XRE-family HTH domain
MDTGKKAVRKLGKRVKQLRESKRWTQQHLAASLGVEQSYISGIERGEYSPSFPRLARLAEIFDLTISDLCQGI